MNRNILILLYLVFVVKVYSQNDTVLNTILKIPNDNCEMTTFNCQRILPQYKISQTKSIKEILSIWEIKCGEVEPIIRLKILLDIKERVFVDKKYERYVSEFIYVYKDRVSASKGDNYKVTFNRYKSYYSYLPLRSKFDEWTKSIAQELIKEQKTGTSEYLLCLLFSEQIDYFYEEIKSKEYEENFIKTTVYTEKYDTWQKGMIYNAFIGTWIPLGKLSDTFSPCPLFGFHAGFAFNQSVRFDIGINIRIQNQYKPFLINADNTITEVNSEVGFTGGLWVTKEYKLENKIMLDAIVGLGIGYIDTDLKKVNPNPDENDNYYSIETADLSVGMNIRKRIFMRHSVGLNLSYHFAPYNLDKELITEIGSQFFTTSIIYRF